MANSNENDLQCKSIFEALKKYNSGDYFAYNGNLYPVDPDDIFWNTDEKNCYYLDDDGYYYYEIDGEKIYDGDIETVSLYDYFTDDSIYNIQYVIDGNKNFEAVRIMVACGGPNIYINTWGEKIELFWWGSSGEYYLTSDLVEAINNIFAERYEFC